MTTYKITAGENLTGKEGLIIERRVGDDEAYVATSATPLFGVLVTGGAEGVLVTVRTLGGEPTTTGGTFGSGQFIGADDAGKAVAIPAGSAAYVLGVAEEASTASGQTKSVAVNTIGALPIAHPVDVDGVPMSTASGPRTSDGALVTTPDQFPTGLPVQFTGRGDDITNGVIGDGPKLNATRATTGNVEVEYQFIEDVWLVGGFYQWSGADLGDEARYEVAAPATAGTSNVGAGAYAKIAVGGGLSMWVPDGTAGAGDADWDLNLTETLNANVAFTKAVPVPVADTSAPDGHFDFAAGLLTANGAANGAWNLFDGEVVLFHLAQWVQLLADGKHDLLVPNAPAKRLLPHWLHRVKLENVSNGTIKAAWNLLVGRQNTV